MNKIEGLVRDLVNATLRAIENDYDIKCELSDTDIFLELNTLLGAYPEWIPISKRLPEQGIHVIATNGLLRFEAVYYPDTKLDTITNRWVLTEKDDNRQWYKADGESLDLNWATHWQPLPELPEAETTLSNDERNR